MSACNDDDDDAQWNKSKQTTLPRLHVAPLICGLHLQLNFPSGLLVQVPPFKQGLESQALISVNKSWD